MVLDVGRWLPEHPGGAAIIPKQSLNLDCARFFEVSEAAGCGAVTPAPPCVHHRGERPCMSLHWCGELRAVIDPSSCVCLSVCCVTPPPPPPCVALPPHALSLAPAPCPPIHIQLHPCRRCTMQAGNPSCTLLSSTWESWCPVSGVTCPWGAHSRPLRTSCSSCGSSHPGGRPCSSRRSPGAGRPPRSKASRGRV